MTSPNPPFQVNTNEWLDAIKIEENQEVHSAAPILTSGQKSQEAINYFRSALL